MYWVYLVWGVSVTDSAYNTRLSTERSRSCWFISRWCRFNLYLSLLIRYISATQDDPYVLIKSHANYIGVRKKYDNHCQIDELFWNFLGQHSNNDGIYHIDKVCRKTSGRNWYCAQVSNIHRFESSSEINVHTVSMNPSFFY